MELSDQQRAAIEHMGTPALVRLVSLQGWPNTIPNLALWQTGPVIGLGQG
jgi:hypothetical protein